MRRTAQILKFKELKSHHDIPVAIRALIDDDKHRRVTPDEFFKLSCELTAISKALHDGMMAQLKKTDAQLNLMLEKWRALLIDNGQG